MLNLNLWFIVPKNVSKPLLSHPHWSFDQFEFWPLRWSQPVRLMLLYLRALRMLNVATGYSNTTLSYSELNGEHAGESFRSLRHILMPLWACKAKKCIFFHENLTFDLTTRSNVDLGLKIIYAVARSRRGASTVFSAKLYGHQGPIARGVVPPLHWRRWRNTENEWGFIGNTSMFSNIYIKI